MKIKGKIFWVPLSILLLVSMLQGQSCCLATGSTKLSNVGRCQKGVLSTGINLEHSYGTFNGQGEFAHNNNSVLRNWTQTVAGGVALFYPYLSIHGEAPIVIAQNRILGERSGSSFINVGDVFTFAQFTLLQDAMSGIKKNNFKSWVPFFDITLGVIWPTGKTISDSEREDQSDVTGTGFTRILTSVKITKFILQSFSVTMGAGYGVVLEQKVKVGSEYLINQPGDTYNGQVSFLYYQNINWSYVLSASFDATQENSLDSFTYADSDTYQFKMGAFINRVLVLPIWELSTGVTFDPWWQGAGKNQSFTGANFSIMIRRNFI